MHQMRADIIGHRARPTADRAFAAKTDTDAATQAIEIAEIDRRALDRIAIEFDRLIFDRRNRFEEEAAALPAIGDIEAGAVIVAVDIIDVAGGRADDGYVALCKPVQQG